MHSSAPDRQETGHGYGDRGGDGGFVHVEASQDVTIDGTIDASGPDSGNWRGGGGSGDGIYVVCNYFSGTGALIADGGDAAWDASDRGGGGGGGGRIAIVRHGGTFLGTTSVAPGASYPDSTDVATIGTVYFNPIPEGSIITFR